MLGREAYRAALILINDGAISRAGFNGPYEESGRQVGFVNYGISHVMRLVGTGERAQRSSWYQKWNVHMFARPEVRLTSSLRSGIQMSVVLFMWAALTDSMSEEGRFHIQRTDTNITRIVWSSTRILRPPPAAQTLEPLQP